MRFDRRNPRAAEMIGSHPFRAPAGAWKAVLLVIRFSASGRPLHGLAALLSLVFLLAVQRPASAADGLPPEEADVDSTETAPLVLDPVVAALNPARVNMSKGYTEKADSLARATLEQFEAQHGPDSVPVARAISLILENMWRWGGTKGSDGRELAARALAILEPRADTEPEFTAALLTNVASFLHVEGDLDEAEAKYRKALALREKHDGPNATATGKVLNSLANLYALQGKNAEAEKMLLRVVQIYRDRFGEEAKSLGTAYTNLGTLLGKQGRIDEALGYFERALAIREKRLGEKHIDVARVLFNIGGLRYDQGDFVAADSLYRRGIDIQVEYAESDKPFIAPAFENMANIAGAQGHFEEADEWIERAIAARQLESRENDPGLAGALNLKGRLLWKIGRHADAVPYFEESYAMRVATLGSGDPGVAEPLHNIPWVLAAPAPQTLPVPKGSPILLAVPVPEQATAQSRIEVRGPSGGVVANVQLSLASSGRPAVFTVIDANAVSAGRYDVSMSLPEGKTVRSSFLVTPAGS